MTDVQERPLMTTVDVSRVLRCSLQTVRRYESEGRDRIRDRFLHQAHVDR